MDCHDSSRSDPSLILIPLILSFSPDKFLPTSLFPSLLLFLPSRRKFCFLTKPKTWLTEDMCISITHTWWLGPKTIHHQQFRSYNILENIDRPSETLEDFFGPEDKGLLSAKFSKNTSCSLGPHVNSEAMIKIYWEAKEFKIKKMWMRNVSLFAKHTTSSINLNVSSTGWTNSDSDENFNSGHAKTGQRKLFFFP